ncbi:hypothetical protein C4B60_03535 [Jeotgalibacillus proteolyticus]|uniref:Heavy metal-binding domain-containing protein n=1 Tax=Jeotgalibacillus proteolyticus TaxID=2082395 RepID=A0A2S5GHL8_9BACL|nr:hypothetical protein C4B60_03535 [Jeotgalibacillus proteolyticus]
MLMTTTHSLEGKKIIEYYGIVTGEAILGAKAWSKRSSRSRS